MNTSWSDEDSEDNQNKEEDLIGNVAFTNYLFNNVCSLIQKMINYVATETTHYYKKIVSVNNVATLEKECDNLT